MQELESKDSINIQAAECMGRLHDALKASKYQGHPLERLLVRLLFCLFADNTGIFQPAQSFRSFIEERTSVDGSNLGPRLAQVFQALNTIETERSRVLDTQVAAFPYINGQLFAETLPLAEFNSAMREMLLDACALDWSAISPAIFGSLFQSIMDATARRNLGAHYTSEENILKLIGPLFLDSLYAEFDKVKNHKTRLQEFHNKLRQLTFFDPACGCGNFLVVCYRELRLLELQVLRASYTLSGKVGQQSIDVHSVIGVNVDQFYGIEIEEFPAQIAQVALWLVDHQMNLKVSEEFGLYFARIPLITSPHIVHGNALQLDWQQILRVQQCSFVLGNPPFLGKKEQSAAQKGDFLPVMGHIKGFGVLDFVAAWYVKAAHYLKAQPEMQTRCAFVSTNSIVQGEQVGILWSWMLAQGIHIHFAHRTFRWSNEGKGKAVVHCIIIGFGLQEEPDKVIYDYEDINGKAHPVRVININPYLVDAPNVLITKRTHNIGGVNQISYGSMANDDGNLILDAAERESLLIESPALLPYIKPFMGGQEFLNNEFRWCLWFKDAPSPLLKKSSTVRMRLAAVKKFRSGSPRKTTQKLAAAPHLFGEIRQPNANYIFLPKVSSENRPILPIGFVSSETIANGSALIVPDGSLLMLGILQSAMHMAWMRFTAGRMKSDYQYSAQIVYNNFPWPDLPHLATDFGSKKPLARIQQAQAAIEIGAQAVLDARAQFTNDTLADLYDPLVMPLDLQKAHRKLDAAVDKAYALCGGPKSYANDSERVAFLFRRYQQLTSLLPQAKAPTKRRKTTLSGL